MKNQLTGQLSGLSGECSVMASPGAVEQNVITQANEWSHWSVLAIAGHFRAHSGSEHDCSSSLVGRLYECAVYGTTRTPTRADSKYRCARCAAPVSARLQSSPTTLFAFSADGGQHGGQHPSVGCAKAAVHSARRTDCWCCTRLHYTRCSEWQYQASHLTSVHSTRHSPTQSSPCYSTPRAHPQLCFAHHRRLASGCSLHSTPLPQPTDSLLLSIRRRLFFVLVSVLRLRCHLL